MYIIVRVEEMSKKAKILFFALLNKSKLFFFDSYLVTNFTCMEHSAY